VSNRRPRLAPAGVPLAWVLPAALFLAAFFIAPLVRNAFWSIYPQGLGTPADLSAYARLFADPFYLDVLGQTLWLSAITAVIAALIGYPIAYFMVRSGRRWQGVMTFLLIAPLLTSIIMRTYGWRVLMSRLGLVNALLRGTGLIARPIDFLSGPGVVMAALVHVLVPFMVLSIAASLQAVDGRLEEAARLLGASRISTFLRITVPLTLDGVGTGVVLVFMLANGSFVTLLLLGGGLQTLPLLIFQQFNTTRDFAFAGAMSNVLLVAAVLCLLLQARLIRRRGVA
jgi:putative spermidine/putrescine transport system permease protein